MNMRLALLRIWIPAALKRARLRDLARVSAQAFGVEPPDLEGVEFAEALERFAVFLKTRAEETLERVDGIGRTGDALEEGTCAFGEGLRRELGVRTGAEAYEALAILYRTLGIAWRTDEEGRVTVSRCFFAGRFTPPVCAFVSALDRGLVRGLTQGGELVFTERLTEGAPACRARITGTAP
jgi:hypothetical protein